MQRESAAGTVPVTCRGKDHQLVAVQGRVMNHVAAEFATDRILLTSA